MKTIAILFGLLAATFAWRGWSDTDCATACACLAEAYWEQVVSPDACLDFDVHYGTAIPGCCPIETQLDCPQAGCAYQFHLYEVTNNCECTVVAALPGFGGFDTPLGHGETGPIGGGFALVACPDTDYFSMGLYCAGAVLPGGYLSYATGHHPCHNTDNQCVEP